MHRRAIMTPRPGRCAWSVRRGRDRSREEREALPRLSAMSCGELHLLLVDVDVEPSDALPRIVRHGHAALHVMIVMPRGHAIVHDRGERLVHVDQLAEHALLGGTGWLRRWWQLGRGVRHGLRRGRQTRLGCDTAGVDCGPRSLRAHARVPSSTGHEADEGEDQGCVMPQGARSRTGRSTRRHHGADEGKRLRQGRHRLCVPGNEWRVGTLAKVPQRSPLWRVKQSLTIPAREEAVRFYHLRYLWYLTTGVSTVGAYSLAQEWWDEHYRRGGLARTEGQGEFARYLMLSALITHHAPGGSVLDVGCGTGQLGELLGEQGARSPSRYVGLDRSAVALERAAERLAAFRSPLGPACELQLGDFDTYRIEDSPDAVVFNETLYYAPNPSATVARYARVLRGGGILIVSMWRSPGRSRIWRSLHTPWLRQLSRCRITVPRRPAWDIAVFARTGVAG